MYLDIQHSGILLLVLVYKMYLGTTLNGTLDTSGAKTITDDTAVTGNFNIFRVF